jgi:cytochrome c-type biogenesis protein CcmE
MQRKHKRLVLVLLGLLSLGLGVWLIARIFNDNIVFFYSPSELQHLTATHHAPQRAIRIGGLVKEGSISRDDQTHRLHFTLTDLTAEVAVRYNGLVPGLFREGQGMVARGTLSAEGVFIAEELLAKHDERYMPKDVADSLKKSGKWRPEK